ncbi:hypothetical protein VDG1235_2940 [Verrucomicrobiia bacterium DG1235]|nr:hypothetical protein VDG1235_2940 [Verrucomicrobiae bacterium DG1235]
MKTYPTLKRSSRAAKLLSALAAYLATTTTLILAKDQPAEFVILANKDNPIQTIEKSDLARLYLSKTRKVDGHAYRVVNLAEDQVKEEFLSDLTSMSPAEIERHYITMELRGEGEKPKEVSSSKSMIFLLIKSDKIIGWLPLSEYESLSEPMKKQMRVIRINQ